MKLRTAWVLVVAVLAAGCGGDDEAGEKTAAFEVLDPKGIHFGKTSGEWMAEWWKWIYELPQTSLNSCVMPPDDPTGKNCAYGQDDPASPVFFLTGNYGGISVRTDCKVPAGKVLLMPILCYSSDNAGEPTPLPPADLEAAVQAFYDSTDVSTLFLSVDGESIADLGSFATEITQYSYTLPPEPNTYSCVNSPGVTGKVDPAFAGGYAVLISGLSKGQHTIHSKGEVSGFSLDVTQTLTIE